MVDFVLGQVSLIHVFGAHAQNLRDGDEEVEEVHDFNTGVLLVEFLILCPPFPRHGVDKFGHFLLHGAGIVQNPLGFLLLGHASGLNANAFVKRLLHFENLFKAVVFHGEMMAGMNVYTQDIVTDEWTLVIAFLIIHRSE